MSEQANYIRWFNVPSSLRVMSPVRQRREGF